MNEEDLPPYKMILSVQKICILSDGNKEVCDRLAEDALLGNIGIGDYLKEVKKEIASDKEAKDIISKLEELPE